MQKHKNILILVPFLGLVILFNLHIFGFPFPYSFIFYPDKFFNGEIYRLLTYPFVHVSFYHLILDSMAFIILFKSLKNKMNTKIILSIFCILGSALFACFTPGLNSLGLCGLSGPAHGLFAIYCLQKMEEKYQKPIAAFSIIMLMLKCLFEISSKNILFLNMHLGPVGTPIVWCHLGGTIGGFMGYYLIKKTLSRKSFSFKKKKTIFSSSFSKENQLDLKNIITYKHLL